MRFKFLSMTSSKSAAYSNGNKGSRTAGLKHLWLAAIALFATCAGAPPFSDYAGHFTEEKSFSAIIKNEQGQEFKLGDFRGKVVVIIFSATWCPNCPTFVKAFDSLARKIKADGMEKSIKVISLNVGQDSMSDLKKHYKAQDIQMLEPHESVPYDAIDKIDGVPACIIFNAEGKFVCGYIGNGVNFDTAEFLDYLKSLARGGV